MIIDASVALKWVFAEDDSEVAAGLVGREDLLAPSLMLTEVGNALWKKRALGQLWPSNEFGVQLGLVASLVTILPEAAAIPRALDICLKLNHAIYDCVYLALAEQENDRLVTADRKFAVKVGRSSWASLVELLS